MQTTLILSGARSNAIVLVRVKTAPLADAYGATPVDVAYAWIDEIFTMAPPPADLINGIEYFAIKYKLVRFIAIIRCQSAKLVLSTLILNAPTAALFTNPLRRIDLDLTCSQIA